ncbi:MAG TPA: lyase family protein [Kofleriaceae bacterium]
MTSSDELEIGARLADAPSEEMIASAFAAELEAQRGLVAEIGLADLAHTVVLVEGGVIPLEPGAALLAALLALHDRPERLVLDPRRGDLYTNREAWLVEHTTAAGWLGAGRARREATTIALHLVMRGRMSGLARALVGCGRALADKAASLRDALAPDYTYLQAAQPTSFGHTLLATVPGILRDLDRVRTCLAHWDLSPAGCGSANGSRIPQDRRRMAELLGFPGIVEHARDAMWQADLPIETAAAAVAALVNVDRLAEDLLFFSAAEVGFVELSDAHARASKIMPHKKNPYALAYVRAAANRAIGVQAAMAASGRTPSGQVDNRLFAYGAIPQVIADAAAAINLCAAVFTGLQFHPARAAEHLAASFIAATDLAEVLATEAGIDFRAAHRVVGALARKLADSGSTPSSLTPADVAAAAMRVLGAPLVIDAGVLARALDPAAAVHARGGPGGAAPAAIDALIVELRTRLGDHDAWHAAATTRTATADAALVALARKLSGSR